jgi:virginiamycin B lyase
MMRVGHVLLSFVATLALALIQAGSDSSRANAQTPVALTGQVTSAEEGAMEGVLVSAKKSGSTITITVVSDAQGRYSFPAGKLAPGQYALRIRAVGYDLDNSKSVEVAAQKTTTHDLKLRKTEDLVAQLSNGEWMASIPGTDREKGILLGCVGCHTLERTMRSPHDADTFMNVVLPRMQGYVNQSIPAHPQLRRGERRMEERGDQRVQVYRTAAEYLAKINLGAGSQWKYDLKILPRPSGRPTRVIYTEYDLGRETIEPHDVIVDADGIAWYSSFGEQNLGRLDPKTGAVKEYPIPEHKPGYPTGLLGLRDDKAGNLWLGNMYQATIVKFDRKTEKFQFWQLPPEQNIDAAQVNMVSPQSSHVDGKVWTQNNGFAGVHRLDIATGKIETWEPFKGAKEPHNIYDVIPDSKNNVYFTDFRWRHIGRIDAKTGEVKLFEVPTPASAPRRGMMDAQDRLWFGEYRGDRIAMFDTKSEQFKEWKVSPRWSAPYDVAIDKNEEAWTGSMITDQVTRLDTKSGTSVDYLLPRSTNIRRVFVDNSTTPVTFWVGSNHGASIIKLEPLD